MKKLILLITLISCIISCVSCGNRNPNIHTKQGIEYCDDMCKTMTDLKCTGYYEDIQMPLEDGGIQVLNCKQFCEYEMQNSVQLNPVCIKDIISCEEITTKCN